MQAYNNTDKQLHWLCQTIAKANRTYVPKIQDDSHTNLYFDVLGDRIVGRWINTPTGKYLLSLNLSSLKLEWLNSYLNPICSIATIGKKNSEIEQRISVEINLLGLKPDGFTDDLHFEIPQYSFSSDVVKIINEPELREWKQYRQMANEACAIVLDYLQVIGEIRIWPHHFDTGIYVMATDKMGIGFGLAMKDNMAGSPYLYMSGYPTEGTIDYSELPQIGKGRWEVNEYWSGALLTIDQLSSKKTTNRQTALYDFLKNAIDWFISINQKS